jgi:hypothetical protein
VTALLAVDVDASSDPVHCVYGSSATSLNDQCRSVADRELPDPAG